MGSCSNRGPSKEERIMNSMSSVLRGSYENRYSNYEAAKIRGELGVERGNQFIDTCYKTFRQ